jgi:hypothetical protein
MTAAKPLARYSAIERRARERLPQHRSYTTTGDATGGAAAPLSQDSRTCRNTSAATSSTGYSAPPIRPMPSP